MHGFYNRLLRVNLTAQTWSTEPISDQVLSAYLGGKGLGAYLLLENTPAGVDPLAPENPLVIAVGPASGAALAPTSRNTQFSKSGKFDCAKRSKNQDRSTTGSQYGFIGSGHTR